MAINEKECALCHKIKPLCRSHLMPSGFYKFVPKGTQSILVTPNKMRESSKQIETKLLCKDCELMLSRDGEQHAIELGYRGKNKYKFSKILDSYHPIKSNEHFNVYNGSSIKEIDINKLIYFGVSVFWRASVHRWKIGHEEYININLERKYQEQFRLFLLNKVEFPNNSSIILYVDKEVNFPAMIPPRGGITGKYFKYKFQVPGFQYILNVGEKTPSSYERNCLYRSSLIFQTDLNQSGLYDGMLRLMKKSEPSKKLNKKYRFKDK